MKKALSFILALVITLMPVSVFAAEGDPVAVPSWEYCIYSGDTVTVEAGATVYFEIGTDQVSGTYDFVVEGTGDFDVAVCGESGDGAYTEGTPVSSVDGKVETQLTSYDSTYCYGCFSITNNSDDSVDYVCTIVFPEGSQGNPFAITVDLDENGTVTIPAGAAYYVAPVLPSWNVEYQLIITGNTGFAYSSGFGMPTPDADGVITTSISANMMNGFKPSFALLNNTDNDQTYTLDIEPMPVGSQSNPLILEAANSSYTAEIAEGAQGYFAKFTAPYAGIVTVTMDSESGWMYYVNNITAGVYGDWHYYDDEEVVASETLEVVTGDELEIIIISYDPIVYAPAGTIDWSFGFDYYTVSEGDNLITADPNNAYNVFAFAPEATGNYTFSSDDALVGIISYNGMWISIEPSAETITESSVEWECTGVGQTIFIAVAPNGETANLNIAYEEVIKVEIPWTYYENEVTPEAFVFEGDAEALLYVDTFDEIVDTAVLGEDGFYHLNSADGPILYANINDDLMSLLSAYGYGQLKDIIYDEEGNVIAKVDYNTAFEAYMNCADAAIYLYPLTADLKEMFIKVGAEQNWYGEEGWVGGDLEDAWMFACYYSETPEYVLGDATGDGELTAADYMIIKQLVFSMRSVDDLKYQETAALRCDMNGDEKYTAVDYLMVKKAIFA